MQQLIEWLDLSTVLFAVVGFIAQLCDGALGMGFGVISSTVLTLLGLPREIVSATVNGAKMFTGTASGLAHLHYKNVHWPTLGILTAGGLAGGIAGAWLLTQGANRYVGSLVSGYLIFLGAYLIWRASHFEQLRITTPRIVGVGIAAGFLEAGAGVWGPLATSNLVAFGLPARLAVGVGNLAETFVAMAVFSVLVHHIGFEQLSHAAIGLVIGALIAAPLAAKMTASLSKPRLTIGIGVMVMASSVVRLCRDFGLFD